MTEKGGTFGMDRGGYGDLGRNPLGADKVNLQPLDPNKLSSAIEAKMEDWNSRVVEKWNVFHDKDVKSLGDYEIEKNSKLKILESALEQIYTLSLNLSSKKSRKEVRKYISIFNKEIEKIKKIPLDLNYNFKKLEELKNDIQKFYMDKF